TILGQDNFELVDNITWLKDYTYLNFLRDIGKHVPMRQMLNRDFVNRRLSDEGHGISYAEFSYVLIQAYDFLHLNKNKDVTLQVCGSDQWGNSIAGVELVRRINGSEAHVYSVPLIVDDATGRKFGKSEEGAIWLDSAKTTPTQFFQFWINIPDDKVESYIKLFTSITQEELTNLMNQQKDNPAQRSAQNYLAVNVTKLVHGVESTNQAQKVTDIIIGKQDLTNALDQATLDIIKRELPNTKISAGSEIAQVLVKTQLAPSNSEARKLITSKAISINGQKISKDKFDSTDFKNGLLILRRGKAFKDSALIELE
ncbi:MAG TPA: tyrosine--tRNA ligase, partial [Patescibacteria group bacterium]|nr:tyrosine--tRNA ligase [Patescibacteria group bacterium]